MILFTLLSIGILYALPTVTLNNPNNEWSLTSSVNFNFTANASSIIPWCAIYTNHTVDHVLSVAINLTDLVNATDTVIGVAFNDTLRVNSSTWNVTCANGTAGTLFGPMTALFFGVDANPPTITIVSPDDGAYLDVNTTNLTFIPTDSSNPENCSLYTNISGTWLVNESWSPFLSGETYGMNTSLESVVDDGLYIWNVLCTDSARPNGVWAETASNRTFIMDTINPTQINLTSPLNNTISTNSTPIVIWNRTTDVNFDKYLVLVATDFGFSEVIQSIEISSISTNFTVLDTLENDDVYYIRVQASDLAGRAINSTNGTIEYVLDTTAPSVTLNAPANATFTNDNTPDFNVTMIDDNPDECFLYLTVLDPTGAVGNMTLNTSSAVTNNTLLTINPAQMAEGSYFFNLGCNDTTDKRTNVSSTPLNITIDTINPSAGTDIISTWGGSNNTDLTPTLNWNAVTDANFDRYEASAYYVVNGTLANQVNESTLAHANMTLTSGLSYFFNVTAYDLAGNTNSSKNQSSETLIFVDTVCGILYNGWNLCGVVWTAGKDLARIGAETNASMISVWNNSNKAWATCNYQASSSGTNCDLNTSIIPDNTQPSAVGNSHQHVWVNVGNEINWRNRTWEALPLDANITLFDLSSNGWNIVPGLWRNGRTFGHLGNVSQFGLFNVTMFSKPYNINGSSAPFINIDPFVKMDNNVSILDYGEAMWAFYNKTNMNTTFDIGGW